MRKGNRHLSPKTGNIAEGTIRRKDGFRARVGLKTRRCARIRSADFLQHEAHRCAIVVVREFFQVSGGTVHTRVTIITRTESLFLRCPRPANRRGEVAG